MLTDSEVTLAEARRAHMAAIHEARTRATAFVRLNRQDLADLYTLQVKTLLRQRDYQGFTQVHYKWGAMVAAVKSGLDVAPFLMAMNRDQPQRHTVDESNSSD